VRRGGERVVHVDVGGVGAAQHRAVAHVEARARVMAHRGHHLEPRLDARAQIGQGRLASPGAGRLRRLGRRRAGGAREVLHRAPRDPKEEQEKDGEKAELERDGYGIVHATN
jgi:hypothetical protein